MGSWLHSPEQSAGTSVEHFDSLVNAELEMGKRSTTAPAEAPLTIESAGIFEVAASA